MEKIGKYSIQCEVGKGGMGVVYRGIDPLIGRTVAIKTIRLDTLRQDGGKEEAFKRFVREAQAAGNMSHPNIVTIYDVGEHEGLLYIAMEFIAGRSLESLLQEGRRFTVEEIVRLLGQVASALDYAHQKGIIHRDIKPANILVGEDLKVSLVDFGIARTSTSTMTQTGMLMGTPRYMSPEQIAGKKVDNRSDIFSLGAILYELLTQHNPFEGESITTVIYKIMHAELEPLSDFNKQLPPGLEAVVRKALARDPDARYRTCAELYADLERSSLPPKAEKTILEAASRAQATMVMAPGESLASVPPARSRKPLFILLAALVVVAAAVIIVVGIARRQGIQPADTAGEIRPAADMPQDDGEARAAGSGAPAEESAAPPATVASEAKPGPEDARKVPMPAPKAGGADADAAMIPARTPEEKQPAPSRLNSKGFRETVYFNDTVMVQIPAGSFTIGSPEGQGNSDEHPAHRVFISDFQLGKTEVTFAQFDVFCRDSGRRLPGDEGWGRGSRPVINVTWEDADAYCRWLAQKTGRNFRLPREAEWEKAARERYPWGARAPAPTLANMKGNSDGFDFTSPVGSFPAGASPYGILDMAGNVWEWMADWYDPGYYRLSPDRDPPGPASGTSRSVRGGSWTNGGELIRSANRSSESPDRFLNVLGFRVAMDGR